ncbi:MAG: Clp protease ClpP [Halanaerobiales bacterium]|nr:Clp protease ClpP [Halanaerobiales bacterium]
MMNLKDFEGLSMSLYDALRLSEMRKGIFHYRGEIDGCETEDFLLEIAHVRESPSDYPEITIRISSNGGSVYNAFSLYDVLRELSQQGVHVRMVVEGLAASAAAMIFLQGADERIALPTSSFLLHEVSRWVSSFSEKSSALEDEMEALKRITEKIIDILSERCNKSRDEVRKVIERKETWLSAKEALEWNLIDKISGKENEKE